LEYKGFRYRCTRNEEMSSGEEKGKEEGTRW